MASPSTSYLKPDDMPYSGIINWDEENKRLEEEQKRQQEVQKKIMRTNAIGDAFRLLFDTVGAGKGATVVPRAVNPGIAGASAEMLRSNSEFGQRKDRLRLTEIAALQREEDNRQALERQREEQAFRSAEEDKQRAYTDQVNKTNFDQQKEMEELRFKNQGDLYDRASKARMNETAQEYALRKEAEGVDANNPYQVRYRQQYGTKAPFTTIEDMENGMTIPISEGQAGAIIKMLRQDPAIPVAIKNKIQPEDLRSNTQIKQYVFENWGRYKNIVRKMAMGEAVTESEIQSVMTEGAKQKKRNDYDAQLQKINESDMTARKRVKEIKALNQKYSDLFINEPSVPAILEPDSQGVTDVSAIFN